jgi:hypothetical protein
MPLTRTFVIVCFICQKNRSPRTRRHERSLL